MTSPASTSVLYRVWRLFPSMRALLMTLATSLSALVVAIQTVAAMIFTRDTLTDAQFDSFLRRQLAVGVVSVLVVSLVVFWVSLAVTRPLRDTLAFLNRLVARDLSTRMPVDGRDEVGRIAEGLNRMTDILAEAVGGMSTSAGELSRSAEELTAVSRELGGDASSTSTQAGVVSSAAGQVSSTMQSVAAGIEQMGGSIGEIARSATEAARVSSSGVTVAAHTNEVVGRLGESSTAIHDVVRTIAAIAAQTNLLALNATIEAARAGESGKGFAVVAGEVKALAQQTSDATEDISQRVAAIQAESGDAVEAINKINGIIAEVSSLQNTIAAAVEEQTAVTGEIGRGIADAAGSSSEIAEGVTGVAGAARNASARADRTHQLAESLRDTSHDMRTLVDRFTLP
ncbi:methyl-accepting chemotaxis protein [Actinoplanes sp. NPDC051475]|uniref:methyl-accepting chemotaxis protein n=1 Tax=Actinoplanes sp. NPDC051475 TaxID=3157225 RepID=UPI00344EA93F